MIVIDAVGYSSANAPARVGASASSEAGRLEFLDAARVVATLAVVWVHVVEVQGHSTAVAALGRFGTSFYLAAVVLLAIRASSGGPRRPGSRPLMQRARRLLVPFVVWSAVYAAFYGVMAILRGDGVSDLVRWWGPLAGTARHLWFLPFAFAAGVVTLLVAPRWDRCTTRGLFASTLAAAAISYVVCHGILFFALDRPWLHALHLHRFDRWVEEAPLVVLVMGSMLWVRRLAQSRGGLLCQHAKPLRLLVAGLFVVVQGLYAALVEVLRPLTGSESRFLAHAAGLLLMAAFALSARSTWVRHLAPIGRSTYFVFLAHVLVLDLAGAVIHPLGAIGPLQLSMMTTVSIFLGCSVVGTLSSRVFRHHLQARTQTSQ